MPRPMPAECAGKIRDVLVFTLLVMLVVALDVVSVERLIENSYLAPVIVLSIAFCGGKYWLKCTESSKAQNKVEQSEELLAQSTYQWTQERKNWRKKLDKMREAYEAECTKLSETQNELTEIKELLAQSTYQWTQERKNWRKKLDKMREAYEA